MGSTGNDSTILIILRGNSASGKSTAAGLLRQRCDARTAIVPLDVIRRDVLKEPGSGKTNAGLIDLMVRYCLDHGYVVILEGILSATGYGDMIRGLRDDHRGRTHLFYWDVPFEETARRHATKPIATEVTTEQLREWYRESDQLGLPDEVVIPETMSLDEAVSRIIAVSGLVAKDTERHP